MAIALDAGTWRATLPDGWTTEEDDDSLLVFHPDGPGTLQVTCSEMEEGLVDEDDLRYFADELIQEGVEPTRVRIGPLQGLRFEYDDEDTSEWVVEWYLASDDLFFFITYSCPRLARGAEDALVSEILHSFELVH